MSKIIVDDILRAKLSQVFQTAEVRDAEGKLLGHFTPVIDPELLAAMQSPASDEELARREREETGRPLADILADLERRG
ncbi:MAG: hypothetical protein JNM56_09730 [Planctomycetia bacterium]|nr:hypothetical protein [Planctomycetia bacterium]